MYLRFKAHGYIIKEIGIIQPESRYLMSGIAVSIKSDLRYCASGMAVQNCPEYSLDFFNKRIYTEDKKDSYTKDDLKKVFAYFNKTHNATIQINSTVIFWDCLTEYENRIVTVRNYDGINYTESKKSYDKTKKEYYAMIQ